MTEQSPLEAAKKLLIGAAIGSCTCNTKSPELLWHAPNCRYVTIMTALENVEIAASPANEEQGPPHWRTWNGAVLDAGERQVTDPGESRLPLQYEDGPDYCTVKDAQGRDFALTMQPDLMKAMEEALSHESASFVRGTPAANPVLAIHEALTKANLEYSGYSCNGVNLFGERKSIDAAARAFHSHSQIDWYQRNLRHWREECGKVHARLSTAVEALRSIHGRLWRDDEPYDERLGDLKSLALGALSTIADAPPPSSQRMISGG